MFVLLVQPRPAECLDFRRGVDLERVLLNATLEFFVASRIPGSQTFQHQESANLGDSLGLGASDVVDPLWRRVLNDRFTILEPIGSGGMGKVYRAVQAPLDRVVALKVLNPSYANGKDPEFRRRFFLEASLTSKLRHPNTITVIDYGQTPDGIFYIAMEYLEGETLSQHLTKSGPLRWMRCLHITQQICRSLREAHKLGVIHRDLKPANVMLLTEDRESDMVKVLDFGLVKSFISEEGGRSVPMDLSPPGNGGELSPEVTHGGMFLGSPQYMAPEQARNKADQRSDIYSLGATLYHMMVGRPPFWAKDSIEVIFMHINEPVPPPRSVRPDLEIPPEVEAVVMKCLEKRASKRFQSMEEVLEGIKRAAIAAGGTGSFDSINSAGFANTPPPMSAFEVPSPPADPASAYPDSTLSLDISVLAPDSSPTDADLWYRRREWQLIGLGLGLAITAIILWPAFRSPRINKKVDQPKPSQTFALSSIPVPNPTLAAVPTLPPQAKPNPPKTVKFKITSDPPGASVSMRGKPLGVTPLSFEVPGGADGTSTVELRLTLRGYHPMTVTAGGSSEVLLSQRLRPRSSTRSGSATTSRRDASRPERSADKPEPATAVAPTDPKPSTEIGETGAGSAKTSASEQVESPSTSGIRASPFGGKPTRPVQIDGEPVVYTPEAIAAKVEGRMTVKCTVTTQGKLENCQVLKSVPLMEEAVLASLATRRYRPATQQGLPVAIDYIISINLVPPP